MERERREQGVEGTQRDEDMGVDAEKAPSMYEERWTDRQRCGEGDRQTHRGMGRRQGGNKVMDTEICTKLQTWQEDHKTERGRRKREGERGRENKPLLN